MILKAGKRSGGFTLVEMIMVIVILGVIGLVLAQIIFSASRGYHSRTVLKRLQSDGRRTLAYLERELRYAVPDSVRLLAGGAGLEYGRTFLGGHYRQIDGHVIQVSDDLDGRDLRGMWLVIYNTHPDDFYGGVSRFRITANDAGSITCAVAIDRESPYQRYYVCDSAVSLGLNGDALVYFSGYEPGAAPANGQFLCQRVKAVSFSLQPGNLGSQPAVRVELSLEDDGVPLTLSRQVRLVNFP